MAQTESRSEEREARLRRRASSRNLLLGGTLVLLLPVLGLLTRRDLASLFSTLEPSGALNHEPDIPKVKITRDKRAAAAKSGNSLSFVANPAPVSPTFAPSAPAPAPPAPEDQPQEPQVPPSDEPPEVNLGDILPKAPGAFAEPEPKSRYPKLKRVKGIAERKKLSQFEADSSSSEREITYYQKTAIPDAKVIPDGAGDKAPAGAMPPPATNLPPQEKQEKKRPAGRLRGSRGTSVSAGRPSAPLRPAGPGLTTGEAVAPQPEAAIGASAMPEPGYRIIQGGPDSAPSPNPEKPMTASSPCPRPGWWKNSSTGLCYHRKDSCSGANAGLGECTQTRP